MRLIDADALIEHLRKDPLFCMIERYGIEGVIESAPTIEPSGDLISREEAVEVANKIVEELALSSIEWEELKIWAKELFDALPSADRPQGEDWERYSDRLWHLAYERGLNDRSKGKWIKVGHDIYECSLCKQHVMTRDIDCYMFCHRCGADMRCGS